MERGTGYQRYLVTLLWVVIGFFYASVVTQWVTITRHDKQFAESIEHIIQLGATENRPFTEIRALLLVKADELSIPIRGDQILLKGEGHTLSVSLRYEEDLTLPIVNHSVYRLKFDHDVAYRQTMSF